MGGPLSVFTLSESEEETLRSLVRRRTTAQAHWRCEPASCSPAQRAIPTRWLRGSSGSTPQTVCKWRARFVAQRLDGLPDEPRPGVPRSIADAKVRGGSIATLEDDAAGHYPWSSREMARSSGISASSVQRIWRAFGLQPHRTETFKLSTDPLFVDKVRDVVGLYMSPPDHALVLCVDEKSQMQALDRTQLLPLSPGQAEPATRARLRPPSPRPPPPPNQSALPVPRRSVRLSYPLVDNYHPAPAIKAWLPNNGHRYHLHFTPTYASWLNQVERWFALLTERQIRRGVHRSIKEWARPSPPSSLTTNTAPRPFLWTKSARSIFSSIARFCKRTLPPVPPILKQIFGSERWVKVLNVPFAGCARSVPTGSVIETDVCIVGAGAAGITLAREFTNASFRVVLVESGGTETEQATQDLYAGSDIGRPYDIFPVSRLRYAGGTTSTVGAVFDYEYAEFAGFPKCARASRIPAGHSRCHIWSRGIGALRSPRLVPYGYTLSTVGASRRTIFPETEPRPALRLPSSAARPGYAILVVNMDWNCRQAGI